MGLPKEHENITGKDWESVRGLWNESRLTNNGVSGTLETFARITLGINSPWIPLYSDLRN